MIVFGEEINEKDLTVVLDFLHRHKSCVKEIGFKKYFPKLYEELMQVQYPEGFTFAQKIFHFFNNDLEFELGKCPVCGKRTKFKNFSKGYQKYCNSVCMGQDPTFWAKHTETNLQRYGVVNPGQSEKIKEKIQETNLQKYGYKCSFQSQDVKQKIKETNLQKYGKEYYNNPNKISETLKSKTEEELKIIIEKRSETYKNKTGYTCPFNNPDVIEKIQKSNLKKYGFIKYAQTEECRKILSDIKLSYTPERKEEINKKRSETCMSKYGTKSVSQVDEFKKKSFETRRLETFKKYPNVIDRNNEIFICTCTDINCNLCQNKQFKIYRKVYCNRQQHNEELCTIKNPVKHSSSYEEKDFSNFIKEIYDGEIILNDRQILDGKEIDIFLPQMNMGFEYNGVYFHSELHKDITYHQEKTLLAKSKGIELIQIWEDDWFFKNNTIKNFIKSKLNIFKTNINADQCNLTEVEDEETKKFINENSIYDYDCSNFNVGLYYDKELIYCMSFENITTNIYKLCGFCSKGNINIINGFHNILSYFIKLYFPKKIISYSSLELMNDKIYKDNGFMEIEITYPTYLWANESTENFHLYNCRKHRYNFTENQLKQMKLDNMSEDETMYNQNYFKCYNSGYILFELNIDS